MNKFIVGLLSCLLFCVSAHGQVEFRFEYLDDGTGVGFDDPILGSHRREALENAAMQFATSLSAYQATVQLQVEGILDGGLSAATPSLHATGTTGFGIHEVVRNKILSNDAVDLNGLQPDGKIAFNFQESWNLGQAEADESSFDFSSAVVHELTHIIGFSSGIFTRAGFFAGDHLGRTSGEWTRFDELLVNANGESVFTDTTLNKPLYQELLVGGPSPEGGLFLNSSTGLVGLYTPSEFEPGSSGVHLDNENPLLAESLLAAAFETGPGPRIFSEVELGLLRDLGFEKIRQIGVVPEPIGGSAWLCALFVGVARFFSNSQEKD